MLAATGICRTNRSDSMMNQAPVKEPITFEDFEKLFIRVLTAENLDAK